MGLTNYLVDPGFELDGNQDGRADWWLTSSSSITGTPTLTGVSALGGCGSRAQRVQYTGAAGDSSKSFIWKSPAITGFAAGDVLTFAFLYKGALAGVSPLVYLNAYNGGSWLANSIGGVSYSPSGTVQRFSATSAALPATTNRVYVDIRCNGVDNGDTIDLTLDDAILVKASADPGYFDGSCRGIWTGTANASTSILVPHPLLLRGAE